MIICPINTAIPFDLALGAIVVIIAGAFVALSWFQSRKPRGLLPKGFKERLSFSRKLENFSQYAEL